MSLCGLLSTCRNLKQWQLLGKESLSNRGGYRSCRVLQQSDTFTELPPMLGSGNFLLVINLRRTYNFLLRFVVLWIISPAVFASTFYLLIHAFVQNIFAKQLLSFNTLCCWVCNNQHERQTSHWLTREFVPTGQLPFLNIFFQESDALYNCYALVYSCNPSTEHLILLNS